MQEGEGEICLPGLIGLVLGRGSVSLLGHFGHGEAADVPHLADTEGDLRQLIVDMFGIHLVTSVRKSGE